MSSSDRPVLYQHTKRENWGRAILVWERGNKRGYQFEDGKLRVFKRGFYDLFEEVDASARLSAALEQAFKRHSRTAKRVANAKTARKAVKDLTTFATQLEIFGLLYPKGFKDPAWVSGKRGIDARKTLKRHRNPAIERAHELLGREIFAQLLEEERHGEIYNRFLELLESTSLTTPAQARPIKRLLASQRPAFTRALFRLLHSDEEYSIRFENFLNVIGMSQETSLHWQLATAPAALMYPEDYVCVRPTTFKKQAATLLPTLRHTRLPNASLYTNYFEMAKTVGEKLKEEGMEPRDFLDIHDFLWETLRPSAKKVLKKKNKKKKKK